MINQNSINQAKRQRCKIGMLYFFCFFFFFFARAACVTTALEEKKKSALGIQDGVQCWRKYPNNLRKPMKCRKVINDAGMFVS